MLLKDLRRLASAFSLRCRHCALTPLRTHKSTRFRRRQYILHGSVEGASYVHLLFNTRPARRNHQRVAIKGATIKGAGSSAWRNRDELFTGLVAESQHIHTLLCSH
jgi:hypothetical protein